MSKVKYFFNKLLCSIKRKIGWKLFLARYKLALVEEGKHFFTCGSYEICKKCTNGSHKCLIFKK